MLTGGGALLHNLDKRLTGYIGTECRVAKDPADCVAIGTGLALRYMGATMYSGNQFEYDFSEWADS